MIERAVHGRIDDRSPGFDPGTTVAFAAKLSDFGPLRCSAAFHPLTEIPLQGHTVLSVPTPGGSAHSVSLSLIFAGVIGISETRTPTAS